MFGTGIKNGEFENGRYDKLHEISTQRRAGGSIV
jgi:hypothetical protein